MNGTIKQLLRVAQYQDRIWLDVLDIVEMAVNNAPLVETDFPVLPHLRLPPHLLPRIPEQLANKNIKAHRFHVGDLVLVSAAKHPRTQLRAKHPLAPKASGPFIIEAEIGPRTFALNLPPSDLSQIPQRLPRK